MHKIYNAIVYDYKEDKKEISSIPCTLRVWYLVLQAWKNIVKFCGHV